MVYRWFTSDEAQLLQGVEADQVTLLSAAVSLGVVPVLHLLSLKLIAEIPIQQIPSVTVGIWSKE